MQMAFLAQARREEGRWSALGRWPGNGLLVDVGEFLGAEGNAPTLEYLLDKALPRFALRIEDRNL
jgi:hypothetical protein